MFSLKMESALNNNKIQTILMYYFNSDFLSVESQYLENELPRINITAILQRAEILDFIGKLEALLNNKEESVTIPCYRKINNTLEKVAILSISKDTEYLKKKNKIYYLLRLEDFKNSKYIHLIEESSRFYSLLTLLKESFRRLL